MACMEHYCYDCNHTVFNNQRYMAYCPKCKSDNVTSHWDDADCQDRDDE